METGSEPEGIEGIDGEVRPEVAEVEPVERGSAVLGRIQEDLDGVERALARVDDGSYGTCQACGVEIPDERLAADPVARFCAEHQAAAPTA